MDMERGFCFGTWDGHGIRNAVKHTASSVVKGLAPAADDRREALSPLWTERMCTHSEAMAHHDGARAASERRFYVCIVGMQSIV